MNFTISIFFVCLFASFCPCSSNVCDQVKIRKRSGIFKGPRVRSDCGSRQFCYWRFHFPPGTSVLTLYFKSLTKPSTTKAVLKLVRDDGRTTQLIKFASANEKICSVAFKSEICGKTRNTKCEYHKDMREIPYLRYKCGRTPLQFEVQYEFRNCSEPSQFDSSFTTTVPTTHTPVTKQTIGRNSRWPEHVTMTLVGGSTADIAETTTLDVHQIKLDSVINTTIFPRKLIYTSISSATTSSVETGTVDVRQATSNITVNTPTFPQSTSAQVLSNNEGTTTSNTSRSSSLKASHYPTYSSNYFNSITITSNKSISLNEENPISAIALVVISVSILLAGSSIIIITVIASKRRKRRNDSKNELTVTNTQRSTSKKTAVKKIYSDAENIRPITFRTFKNENEDGSSMMRDNADNIAPVGNEYAEMKSISPTVNDLTEEQNTNYVMSVNQNAEVQNTDYAARGNEYTIMRSTLVHMTEQSPYAEITI